MYKAQFAYTAEAKTDIHLNIGDKLVQVEDVGNGWSMGHNMSTGKTGTFPTSFISKYSPVRDKIARISFSPQKADKLELGLIEIRTSTVVPEVKAKIPDDILQRRLTQVPGHHGVIGVKLNKMVPKSVKNFGNNLFQSKRGEHRILKGVFGILGGFIACGILFVLLRYSYDYTSEQSGYITAAASIPICIALAVSTHIRCIMLLMLPSLFTGKGRAVFMSVIFAMLLSRSVVNIAYNAEQASESMACTQELIYNQTHILKRQLEEPIRKIEMRIYEGLQRLKNIATSIAKAIEPVTKVVNDFINGLNAAKNALEKAANDCDKGLKSAQSSCESGINNAKTNCEKELKAIDPTTGIINFGKDVARTGESVVRTIGDGFIRVFGKKRKRRRAMTEEEKSAIELAKQLVDTGSSLRRHDIHLKPQYAEQIGNHTALISRIHKHQALLRYKRSTLLDKICVILDIGGICKVVQSGQAVCKPLQYIPIAISKASDEIKKALNAIVSFFFFDFEGDIDAFGNINSSKTAAQIVSEVKADIESKTSAIQKAANIVSNILTLTLLVLFIKSCFYLKNFLSKDRYDNFYITKSFKMYDQQCQAKGEVSVLPLRRRERNKYVDTRSLWLSSMEIATSKKGLAKVAIHLLIATVIIAFDYILYFVLQLIDRYGNLNINVGGSTYLDVSVSGSGMISRFLQAFLSEIQLDEDFGVDFNLTICIPNPIKPDDNNIYVFSFLYFFAFVFLVMQAYGLRLRRKIATFFYPERDEERIKYLHEKIRHNRKSFFSWLKQHLIARNKQQQIENRITLRGLIEYRYPQLAQYICCCLPQRKSCICCSTEQEGRVKFPKCITCQSDYCDECFSDMKYTCLKCNAKSEVFKLRKNFM